ncbi:TIGR02452 family protein [Cladophialophora carrionii]|uniref:TIGR02452 family protein n=1 Tax=Cladophialophora carrionii TaxID=86049 RepID=A0A1C1CSX8_9EURO|nr:TIGR02452 family protein [Cladophialophora carrionii]
MTVQSPNGAAANTDDKALASSALRQSKLSWSSDGRLSAQPPVSPKSEDRDELVKVAKQTISVLPGLLLTRPDAKPDGYLYDKDRVAPLDQGFCPRLPKTKVRVISSDTIDAALQLRRAPSDKPICILNMANAIHAGGGFRTGALAQEEALCYRTSLHFTLKLRFYPLPDKAAIYSPNVLVIRDSLANGHRLLDCRDPSKLPVISVVSAAAIYQPSVGCKLCQPKELSHNFYARGEDRNLMREKIRVIVRTAIRNKHRKIVLGAFGCGAFRNPPKEVAGLFAEVLQEPEFSGGWWEDVVFAVLNQGSAGKMNFDWFERELSGLMV